MLNIEFYSAPSFNDISDDVHGEAILYNDTVCAYLLAQFPTLEITPVMSFLSVETLIETPFTKEEELQLRLYISLLCNVPVQYLSEQNVDY